MSADNLNSMKKYSEGDERMQESIKFLEWYATSELNHGFEDILREKEYIAEEKGIKENQKLTIEKMLKKGYTIKEIIEIVGLPETEILDIEKKLINN